MTLILTLVVTHVLIDEGRGLEVRRVRIRDRLLSRLRAAALDRELASGASPESSIALAVHARHLCEWAERSVLAQSLTRIAAAGVADDRPGRPSHRIPLSQTAIRRSGAELSAVVARLEAGAPVGVQGVARIRKLLTDGTGPLYQRAAPGRLGRELRAALEAMDRVA